MKDAVGALRNYLAVQPEIVALVEDRVFVDSIPRAVIEAADTFHPRKMLVIRQSGGAGKADLMPTEDPTINALCYGETGYEAGKVRRAVWEKLVYLSRVMQDGVLIHHANPTSGPLPLVDPDIVWQAVGQQYQFKASVL